MTKTHALLETENILGDFFNSNIVSDNFYHDFQIPTMITQLIYSVLSLMPPYVINCILQIKLQVYNYI